MVHLEGSGEIVAFAAPVSSKDWAMGDTYRMTIAGEAEELDGAPGTADLTVTVSQSDFDVTLDFLP